MAIVLVDVIFFVVLLVLGMLWLTVSTSALDTCYSFHTNEKNWEDSQQYCKNNGGNLVSMETEEEYQFINTTIQSLNVTNTYKEWNIGLKWMATGYWQWSSGQRYKITKLQWVRNEPYGKVRCVKMIKNYTGLGVFDNIDCKENTKMFICEYKNVTSELQDTIEEDTNVNYYNCYDINGDENDLPSVRPTTSINQKTANTFTTTKEIKTSSENVVQPTTSITTYTFSSTIKIVRKEQQPSPIMLVVIVLAVLLALCICIIAAVFCWFRKKSDQRSSKRKSSCSIATRTVAQGPGNTSNANSEGLQIVGRDSVRYAVPGDEIFYPGTSIDNRANDMDLSAYAEVHDAIPPSAKLTSKHFEDEDQYLNPVDSLATSVHDAISPSAKLISTYYDEDEDQYLNPVDNVPTSDANYYESFELNTKPFKNIASKYDKRHQEVEEAVAGPSSAQQRYLKDATNEPESCNGLYATTDLGSKPNKANVKASKHDLQRKRKDATSEPAACNSLYSTTDLGTKHLNDTNSLPSFYNKLYECTDLLVFQRDEATNEDPNQGMSLKEDKARDCHIEATSNGNGGSRHSSIGSIMSSSRKNQDMPLSIPTPRKQPSEDVRMYAMADLLNNGKDVDVVYAQVNNKHKKQKE